MNKERNTTSVPLLLLFILVIGLVVRCWGINFGLPHTMCRPDEQILVNIAFGFGKGDFNPHYFIYPTLYMYLAFVTYVLYFGLGLLLGRYTSTTDLVAEFVRDPSNFFLINRGISALLGTATIFVIYKIARGWFNERIALISAFFLSLTFLHVRDSHFGVTDVPMTFFIMCAVWVMTDCYNHKRAKDYTLAGIFTGLATSTKYAGILLGVPMTLVHYFNTKGEHPHPFRHLFDRRIVFFGMALLISFLAGTPYALLDYRAFLSGFLYDVNHLQQGHWTIVLERGLWYHLKYTLPYGLGWPLFGASLAGIAILLKREVKKTLILFSFPLLYYIPAGWGHSVFVRYMIPLLPFLCMAGALCVDALVELLSGSTFQRFQNTVRTFIAIVIILPSFHSVVQFNTLLSRKDNRLIATEWIMAHIPGGSSIYQHVLPPLELPPLLTELEETYGQQTLQGRPHRGLKLKIEEMRRRKITGYENWEHSLFGDQLLYRNQVQTTLPDYIILGLSPLIYHSIPYDDIQKALKESYILIKSFIALDMSRTDRWYDLQDAFYLPFRGFKGITRPGPNIYIYERKR